MVEVRQGGITEAKGLTWKQAQRFQLMPLGNEMDRITDMSDVLRRYPTREEFGDESVITTATKQR